jgi:3-oxoacyl-[acyl-carrier protein] reductase
MVSRAVLVTGASRNIGAAVSRRFAAAGSPVVLAARQAAEVGAVAEQSRAAGGQAIAVTTDVSDPAQVANLLDRATDAFGRVDVLVNNAVVRRHLPIQDTTPGDWNAVLDVTLTGTFNCAKAVLPLMRARGWAG